MAARIAKGSANLVNIATSAIVANNSSEEFELVLGNLQSLDFGLKGGGWDSQLGRRSTRPRDTAPGFSQCGFNDFPFSK